jgi:ABC-type sugar transport system permease subunit
VVSGQAAQGSGQGKTQVTPTSPGRQRRMLLYPALVIVAIITQIPFVFTVYLSFLNWNLTRPDLHRARQLRA